MNIRIAFLTFALLCLTNVYAQPAYDTSNLDDFFTEWLVCGPFESDAGALLQDFATTSKAESGQTPQSGMHETYDGKSITWTNHQSPDSDVSFDELYGKRTNAVAYAFCQIEAPKSGYYNVSLGTNDGGRLWINGEEIWRFTGERPLYADQDKIAVKLNRGMNNVLLKVFNAGNLWGFTFRLQAFDSSQFHNHRFVNIKSKDGRSYLVQNPSQTKAEAVVKSIDLTLKSLHEDSVVWKSQWKPNQRVEISIPSTDYREYRLHAVRHFVNGDSDEYTDTVGLGEIEHYTLFSDGKTNYSIVVANDASSSEKWAAQELQHWLEVISGARFYLRDDSGDVGAHEFIVGKNRHTLALKNSKLGYEDPNNEGFTIENIGSNILIYGGSVRGTMYGVFDFLETAFGCRWYAPTVSSIPKKSEYQFHYFDRQDAPKIRVRNDFYFEAFEPIWAARNRINGAMSYREQPGGVEGYWGVHTFYYFVPPDEFFESHPEYFSMIDGERQHDHKQLCLTNDDVYGIVLERLKKFMRENPQYLIYSVSQNDWHGACECEKCQSIVKREGSEAGPVIAFVNRLAKDIEKEFPDKFIGTLAYQYTRKCPKHIKPRKNVVVRLCSIECCFSHSFYDCPLNQEFLQDLETWSKRAPHLYIWDYVVNFRHYIAPHPNFYALQPNLQAFEKNNAIGVMEQAVYNTRGGEFAELRSYVLAKLLWNPDLDHFEEIIDDFLNGYYGRSGQYIREYFNLLHHSIGEDDHLHIFDQLDRPYFNAAFVNKSDAIFQKAESVADTVEILHRVQMTRLSLDYLKIMNDLPLALKDGTVDRFRQVCQRENVARISEHDSLDVFWQDLQKRIDALTKE